MQDDHQGSGRRLDKRQMDYFIGLDHDASIALPPSDQNINTDVRKGAAHNRVHNVAMARPDREHFSYDSAFAQRNQGSLSAPRGKKSGKGWTLSSIFSKKKGGKEGEKGEVVKRSAEVGLGGSGREESKYANFKDVPKAEVDKWIAVWGPLENGRPAGEEGEISRSNGSLEDSLREREREREENVMREREEKAMREREEKAMREREEKAMREREENGFREMAESLSLTALVIEDRQGTNVVQTGEEEEEVEESRLIADADVAPETQETVSGRVLSLESTSRQDIFRGNEDEREELGTVRKEKNSRQAAVLTVSRTSNMETVSMPLLQDYQSKPMVGRSRPVPFVAPPNFLVDKNLRPEIGNVRRNFTPNSVPQQLKSPKSSLPSPKPSSSSSSQNYQKPPNFSPQPSGRPPSPRFSPKVSPKPFSKPPLEDIPPKNGISSSANLPFDKPEQDDVAKQEPQQSSRLSQPPPSLSWAMTMKGRSSTVQNAVANLGDTPSFSVEDALNPSDPVVKHAVELAVAVGLEDFKPLLEAVTKERPSVSRRRAVAAAIRALTKKEEDKVNRARVAAADGVDVLVSLLSSSDNSTVEHSVTALLNLSLTECVRGYVFVSPGAVRSIVNVLRTGSPTSKANAAAALFALADTPDRKLIIGESDAMGPLIDLLETGTLRGKKDAALALFSLSLHPTCRREMLSAGVIKPLIALLNTAESGVEEKVVAIISNLVKGKEGRDAIMAERGILLLIDTAEGGSPRAKEDATSALLSLARKSEEAVTELLRESPDLTFNKLCIQGTPRTKKKASMLMEILKLARSSLITSPGIDGPSFHESFSQTFSQDDDDDEDD